MNLVNFIRGCEPRDPNLDLYTPVLKEIEMNKEFGFENTFLLQYDALLREDIVSLIKANRDEHMELGLWFEMGRPLTEAVGIEWRGRPGYDWDWYVNPGFLPAYTPAQREAIIDEAFRLFKETFGAYPQVAGSWLLDAHSMAYMSDKYDMKAFCICREQWAVDAYTLWGGYYSGGYFASRKNMVCPAQTPENTIKTPVYRMLGLDPTYGYDEQKYLPAGKLWGCPTMEPAWGPGSNSDVMDWYFKTYYENPCLAQAHATTGQENSFGGSIYNGYRLQAEKLQALQNAGKVVVEKIGDTGAAMMAACDLTPATALVATEDWAHTAPEDGPACKSVWYSCANYRANLFAHGDHVFFRDMQKFDDRYEERYLTTPCVAWDARFDNLPIVDARLWSTAEAGPCEIALDGSLTDLSAEEMGQTLAVTLTFADGRVAKVFFAPEGITMENCGTAHYLVGVPESTTITVDGNTICGDHVGYTYKVPTNGLVAVNGGYDLPGVDGKVTIDMTDR